MFPKQTSSAKRANSRLVNFNTATAIPEAAAQSSPKLKDFGGAPLPLLFDGGSSFVNIFTISSISFPFFFDVGRETPTFLPYSLKK